MFDPKAKDRTEKYILVGLVSGNPLGCGNIKERLYPDYHVSVGNEEVTGNKKNMLYPAFYLYIIDFRVD